MSAPAIYLEFDDVLAETRVLRREALRAALSVDGIEISDEQFDEHCTGLSFTAAVRAAIRVARITGRPPDETTVELASLRASRTFGESVARGIALAPGVREFVQQCAGKARLAIVTRSPRRDVDLVLGFAELGDAFECIVTAEDYTGQEPAPDPYEIGVSRMAYGKPIVIGEGIALIASLNSVAAARAARLRPLVVGPVSPALAFAGDAYLPSLEGAKVLDLVRLAAGADAR